MSEVPEHHQRGNRQDAARAAAHEAADHRRDERRPGTRARSTLARWRYADAVQAARQLQTGGSTS